MVLPPVKSSPVLALPTLPLTTRRRPLARGALCCSEMRPGLFAAPAITGGQEGRRKTCKKLTGPRIAQLAAESTRLPRSKHPGCRE